MTDTPATASLSDDDRMWLSRWTVGGQPGMGSSCMPLDPVRGADRCRHDLAGLRRDGAIDITDSTECWTPDGSPCATCHGTRGVETAVPDEHPVPRHRLPSRVASPAAQGALW